MITQTIPSYLYLQYNDDDDLQAFVDAYNDQSQQIINWFNTIGLPIYTGTPIAGPLLDWVAEGLYGINRPTLVSGVTVHEGPLNTYGPNMGPALNQSVVVQPTNYALVNDDVFKRVITWHFYKGDGKVLNIRWLKRRIARFLYGYNGTDPGIDQTYRISVEFGIAPQVNITIQSGVRSVLGGLNTACCNTQTLNDTASTYFAYPPIPMAKTFKTAVDNGILELPFQFTYSVSV